jgi:hypothetical protein
MSIREVAENAGIAFGTCMKILTEDLQMRRVSVTGVPSPDGGAEGQSRVNLHWPP